MPNAKPYDPYNTISESNDTESLLHFEDEESAETRPSKRKSKKLDVSELEDPNRLYYDPLRIGASAALDDGVHNIPGSPWAKPAVRLHSRPNETLPIAKYVPTCAVLMVILWISAILVFAVWNFESVGRMIVEIILGVICLFGVFWNSYFTVSCIFKALVPGKAFKTNTKYSSIIPEEKNPRDEWLSVTIQVPVYKESIHEVILPTLESCIQARDFYIKSTGARCNVVVCDDGMMVFLKNNFAAAEMLWETVLKTKGKLLKLSRLLRTVPRPSRQHLKGLQSRAVYEVFHRMLFYYHFQVGFVARSTWDRPGKAKRASNLNSHMRLGWGAKQKDDLPYSQALYQESHNPDGSRFVMFGNDISIGELLVITEANSRMAETVIRKTVPEFLNDTGLGFTVHATKTLDDQRGESFFVNLISAYTDSLYQGHYLLSSILGCHPPLVGQSIFLRSEAVRQCGRVRTLRKAQQWLQNIGIPFLSVDQVGLRNLQDHSFTEYWSENHVSEDFELMIHLYNLGFDGRYIAYPNCEFQRTVSRYFDEEAARQRKLALGATEIVFNPFNTWLVRGPFAPTFKTLFQSVAIPSNYRLFLASHVLSYSAGGTYLLVFSVAAAARILDQKTEESTSLMFVFNSAGFLSLSMVVSYLIGCSMLLIALVRMRVINYNLLFPNYRRRGFFYLVYKQIRYSWIYQLLFYSVMAPYYFLGTVDHLLVRYDIVSAGSFSKSKHCLVRKCKILSNLVVFNCGSWLIGFYLLWVVYTVVLEEQDWDFNFEKVPDDWLYLALFAGPPAIMSVLIGIVPVILNPYLLGFPFHPPLCYKRNQAKRLQNPGVISPRISQHQKISSRMLQRKMRMGQLKNSQDIETGSVTTFSTNWHPKKPS